MLLICCVNLADTPPISKPRRRWLRNDQRPSYLTERRFRYVKLCGDKAGASFMSACVRAGIFTFIFFKSRRTPETSELLRVRHIGERNMLRGYTKAVKKRNIVELYCSTVYWAIAGDQLALIL